MIDHRELIQLYDLGHIEEHSPGLIHWHPHGVFVLRRLEQYIRELHERHGYQEVRSPILLSRALWEKSGHWEKYQDLMFVAESEESAYAVKPMSCPGHISIYQQKRRSYRELPFRQFEFGHVHRKEMSGALSGWMRLRGFVQDDSHVVCDKHHIEEVIGAFVKMVEEAYQYFGFEEWEWKISLRPEKRAGSDAVWDDAEMALRNACQKLDIHAKEVLGDGAFYGPKLEVVLKDRLGRKWQCGVAQIDFVLPERFALSFQGKDGDQHIPVIIHHAVLGSLERWISIILEHHEKLPQWLSPHDIIILPIADKHKNYAGEILKQVQKIGRRGVVDEEGPLGGRIRAAEHLKYENILVVGEKEEKNNQVNVRQKNGQFVMDQIEWIKSLS